MVRAVQQGDGGGGDGVADVVRQEVRTARKEHQCDWCHRTIAKGQPYLYQAVADGGTVYDFKTCSWCFNLIAEHPRLRGRWMDQGLFEDIVHGLCQEYGCERATTADRGVAILGEVDRWLT